MIQQYILRHSITYFSSKHKLFFATLIIAAIHAIFYASRGIDMTDTGLQLYLQKNAFAGSGDTWMTVPLTNFIGGVWLSLAPFGAKMFWAYLGGAILYIIIMLLSFEIYSEFFKYINLKDWFVVIGTVLFIPIRCSINYYYLPVILSYLFFCLLLKSLRKNHDRNWFFLGALGGVILFSRFTFITILFIPIFICAYWHTFNQEHIGRKLVCYIGGIMLAIIPLCILFLLWKSQFSTLSSEIIGANIIYRTKSFILIILPICRVFSTASSILILIIVLEKRFSTTRQAVFGKILLALSFLCAMALLIFYTMRDGDWWTYFGAFPNSMLSLLIIPSFAFILLFCTVLDKSATGIYMDPHIEKPYIVSMCLFSFAIPLGSDVGFCKLGYMASAYTMILGGLLIHRMNCDYPMRHYVFFAILMGGIIVRPIYNYLDAPVFKCNTMPTFPGLKYLYTTKQRADDWDGLLYSLKRHIQRDREVMMVGYLNFGPLYLLDVQDWNHGVCTGGHDFMTRFNNNLSKKELPRVAFADENSEEFTLFYDILSNRYKRVFLLKRKHFIYSVWTKNE